MTNRIDSVKLDISIDSGDDDIVSYPREALIRTLTDIINDLGAIELDDDHVGRNNRITDLNGNLIGGWTLDIERDDEEETE